MYGGMYNVMLYFQMGKGIIIDVVQIGGEKLNSRRKAIRDFSSSIVALDFALWLFVI